MFENGANHPKMFPVEANGLAELHKSGAIRVPEVLYVTGEMLLLESHHQIRAAEFLRTFRASVCGDCIAITLTFGFYEDNFIGATHKSIILRATPPELGRFFWEKRLLFNANLRKNMVYATPDLTKLFGKLESQLPIL
ncbi:MAG: fructosamine kinase family protein [Calditrichia bacterium]